MGDEYKNMEKIQLIAGEDLKIGNFIEIKSGLAYNFREPIRTPIFKIPEIIALANIKNKDIGNFITG